MKTWNLKSLCAAVAMTIASASGAGAAPPVEDDLKYCIEKFESIAVGRPAKLLAHPLVKTVLAAGPAREVEEAFKVMREQFDLDLAKLERVTLFTAVPTNPAQPDFGIVIRLSEPYNEQSLRHLFEKDEEQGKTFWQPKELPFCYWHLVDPKTAVGAWTKATLLKMLSGKTVKSPLLDHLKNTNLNHDYVQVTEMAAYRKAFGDLIKAQALLGGNVRPEEAAIMTLGMTAMEEANALEVAVDLDGPTLVSVRIDASGPEAATRLEGTLDMAVHLGSSGLRTYIQETLGKAADDSNTVEIARLLDELLQGVRVARKGQQISVTVSAPRDLNNRMKYLAEHVRRMTHESRYGNNLRQLTIALQNYHDVNNDIVPAYVVDKNGKPLYSWRVLLLPYMEGNEIYEQFHLDEPWDSEHNKQFIARMPKEFQGAPNLREGMTNLLAIVEKNTDHRSPQGETAMQPSPAWDPNGDRPLRAKFTFGSVIDGLSNTAWLVQAPAEKAVPWTKPEEFEFDAEKLKGDLLGLKENDWFFAARLDGSVTKVQKKTDRATLNAFFHCNDRTPFSLEPDRPRPSPRPSTAVPPPSPPRP